MEVASDGLRGGDAEERVVGSAGGEIDRVIEPFAGDGVGHIVSSAGVGGGSIAMDSLGRYMPGDV